jgi:hypothetical protein
MFDFVGHVLTDKLQTKDFKSFLEGVMKVREGGETIFTVSPFLDQTSVHLQLFLLYYHLSYPPSPLKLSK